jgi:hypothetical protein
MHRWVNILKCLVRIPVLEPIAANSNDPVRTGRRPAGARRAQSRADRVDVDQAANYNFHVVSASLAIGHRKRRSGDGNRVMLGDYLCCRGTHGAQKVGHVVQACNVDIVSRRLAALMASVAIGAVCSSMAMGCRNGQPQRPQMLEADARLEVFLHGQGQILLGCKLKLVARGPTRTGSF